MGYRDMIVEKIDETPDEHTPEITRKVYEPRSFRELVKDAEERNPVTGEIPIKVYEENVFPKEPVNIYGLKQFAGDLAGGAALAIYFVGTAGGLALALSGMLD